VNQILRIEFPPRLFTREMAAYYLACSPRQIDKYRELREITPLMDGSRVKYRREDLDRIADRMPEKPERAS